jgi:hypothetical protein
MPEQAVKTVLKKAVLVARGEPKRTAFFSKEAFRKRMRGANAQRRSESATEE